MNVFIALLRGINVGGHKKIKMADLRTLLETNLLNNVKTYIQSGNIVFQSEQNKEALSSLICKIIYNFYGFDVPVLVIEKTRFMSILKNNPFTKDKTSNSYYTILKDKPSIDNVNLFLGLSYPDEEFQLINRCIYYVTELGYGRSKYSNNLAESKLKVQATTRNHRTMIKLLEMANEFD